MGRSLVWYAMPEHIDHDKTKFCMNWEFEETEDEKIVDFYKKYRLEQPDWTNHLKKAKELWYDVMYDCNNNSICPKCLLFANGLYDSPLVKDKFRISHSYGNPIWESKWNVHNLFLGTRDSDFCRRFTDDRLYYEIVHDNLAHQKSIIDLFGKPKRKNDIDACNETQMILNKLKEWSNTPNTRIIYDNEP